MPEDRNFLTRMIEFVREYSQQIHQIQRSFAVKARSRLVEKQKTCNIVRAYLAATLTSICGSLGKQRL